ncbi:alpha/beta hydrolase [Actinomadura keratinilytica]
MPAAHRAALWRPRSSPRPSPSCRRAARRAPRRTPRRQGPRGPPQGGPRSPRPLLRAASGWRTCEGVGKEEFECARLKAPLDYDNPTAGTLDLALSRKKATGPGSRLGSLLVNPGGPGGSAIGYLQSYAALGYPAPVRARYDMVAVDPRGVADSEPVTCLDGPAMDAHTATDTTPDSPAEQQALVSAFQKYGKGCQADAGKTLGHVSTVESARDLDLARSALGDEKLTYVGASYGTFLGATYAGLYPHRVGRLVLDGAMDPTLDARAQPGADRRLRHRLHRLRQGLRPAEGLPPRHRRPPERRAEPHRVLRPARRRPAPRRAGPRPHRVPRHHGRGRRPLRRGRLAPAAHRPDQRRQGPRRRRPARPLRPLLRARRRRRLPEPHVRQRRRQLPRPPPAFATPEEVEAALPEFRKASPVFGEGFAWASLNCAQWPAPATSGPHRIEANGAAPIVVVGTTRDPATPYRWARGLASQLDSATLLTYDGDGHTAFGRGSDCIDTAINTYLLEGTPPDHGTRC